MKKIFETPLYPYERPLDLDSKDDARLILILANHVGDSDVLSEALRAALP